MTRDLTFYHGTTKEQAQKLITMDLAPFDVPSPLLLNWWEYTDFGKGFYTHPEASKDLAIKWAKKKAQKAGTDWGVARFTLPEDQFNNIPATGLLFQTKTSRPANAPIFLPPIPASWLEFVEFNRKIDGVVESAPDSVGFPPGGIQRPKDNDWTARYPWMRGPMWSKGDSRFTGTPVGVDDIGISIPERFHQINWGLAGLACSKCSCMQKQAIFVHERE